MSKYMWFHPGRENPFPHGTSGVKTTTGYISGNIPGYWCSHPSYGPGDLDWWRSTCGHIVEKTLETCPACGDQQQPSIKAE